MSPEDLELMQSIENDTLLLDEESVKEELALIESDLIACDTQLRDKKEELKLLKQSQNFDPDLVRIKEMELEMLEEKREVCLARKKKYTDQLFIYQNKIAE